MWRKIFKIFGFRICCTMDIDGEIRYRFIKVTPFDLRCISVFDLNVILNSDGTTSGCSYVSKWKEV